MSDCYLCGKKAESKTVGEREGVRCSNCKLHYEVAGMSKKFHFNKPGDLDQDVKMKIRAYLKKIGCGDDNSDSPILITGDMINQIKGRAIRNK